MNDLLAKFSQATGLKADPQTLTFAGIGVGVALLLAAVFWLLARRAPKASAARQSLFDKLGLSVFERRLVVAILVVLFIVLQWWFVFPEFKKWGELKAAMARADATIHKYEPEVAKFDEYKKTAARLEGERAQLPNSYDVGVTLLRVVQGQAAKCSLGGLSFTHVQPRPARGNEFFEEQGYTVNFASTGDKELLDFLVAVSADDSLIRVRELSVRPDPTGMKLMGSVTVMASYQKAAATTRAPSAGNNPRKQ